MCAIGDCSRPIKARGWCWNHYRAWRVYGDPLADRRRPRRFCTIDGCEGPARGRGLCGMHYARWHRHGDPLALRRGPAQGWVNPDGYRLVSVPGHANADSQGKIMEHRLVMSTSLGRPLFADETVHHRNGVRTDNRLENLEMRIGAHEQGLSIEDALAWAHEIIRRYES